MNQQKQAFLEQYKHLDAMVKAQTEPIAIVGMGCRFPAGVNDSASYWQLLVNGIDAVTEIPLERWNIADYYHQDADVPGKMYSREGAFLDKVDEFDPAFFGISPREAAAMDPQQRLLLEVCWESLENAAIAPESLINSQTGVFMGIFRDDYAQLCFHQGVVNHIDAYNSLGTSRAIAVGRISYLFGFHGPTLQIDTACSSSLLAVHLACQSLRSQECNLALAGGVNLMLTPATAISNCKLKAVSPQGRSKTFDASADGYGRGEGCGVVVLKRLSDALRDGNLIFAQIRGSAVNHDGKSNGLTAPNGQAQEALLRQALERAKIQPKDLQYVEVHGTGTSLGDPIEVLSLGKIYGQGHSQDNPLILGTVKTNMGHLEGAAGIAALIKTVLQLQNQQIAPNLHFKNPNPYIPWEKLPVKIPTTLTPWLVREGVRRAGVSAFGMSGTNVHLIVEESNFERLGDEKPHLERPCHLITLSAKSEPALRELAQRYYDFLGQNSQTVMANLAYTANTGRSHFEHRLAIPFLAQKQLEQALKDFIRDENRFSGQKSILTSKKAPKLAFMCTGQGSQYPGMARELYETQPTFRQTLEKCDEILRSYGVKSLLQVLYGDEKTSQLINQTFYSQITLFSLEYALAQLWLSWGVKPDALIGHSLGEYVAACLAGVFSLEDGLKLIAHRGRLMQTLPKNGIMAAIFTDSDTVTNHLRKIRGICTIAAVNSRENTVISGETEAINHLIANFNQRGIESQTLAVSHAFHSPLMTGMVGEFAKIAETITYNSPRLPLISNLTGDVIDAEIATSQYWVNHLLSPVEFARGIERLGELNTEIFLEIGAKTTLINLGQQNLPDQGLWLASLSPKQSNWETLLQSLATLYVKGVKIDWNGFDLDYLREKIPLPTYPFQRKRYWLDYIDSQLKTPTVAAAFHPLLQQPLHLLGSKDVHYQSSLSPCSPSYLQEHQVFGQVVFPAAAYLEMIIVAASQQYPNQQFTIGQLSLNRPLIFSDNQSKKVQLSLLAGGQFQILSLGEGEVSLLHLSGNLTNENQDLPSCNWTDIRNRCHQKIEIAQHYQDCLSKGVNYGESFRVIQELYRNQSEIVAKIQLSSHLLSQAVDYQLHPVLLDGCFHAMSALFPAGNSTYLPTNIDRLTFSGVKDTSIYCHGRFSHSNLQNGILIADLTIFSESGQLISQIDGLTFQQARPETLFSQTNDLKDSLYEITWQATDLTGMDWTETGDWLIFADKKGVGQQLAEKLLQQGHRCQLITEKNRQTWQYLLKKPYQGLIYLWGIDDDQALENNQNLAVTQERICGTLLEIVQELGKIEVNYSPRLYIVTQSAQYIPSQPTVIALAQSSLWGLGRTIALEHPELRCLCLDGDKFQDSHTLALEVFQSLQSSEEENQIVWRQGQSYVARLGRFIPKSSLKNREIAENATYLITGGLGALGQQVANWLRKKGAKSLVLLSRRGITPETQPIIDQWRQEGTNVEVFAADVSDFGQMRRAFEIIEQQLPPLKGIIHTAGVLEDASLSKQTWEKFERVFSPKILGAWNLHLLSQEVDLDWFISFSSMASVLGSSGQSNYASANAFLDSLAHYRQAQGLPALTINWGPWAEGGMAENLGEKAKKRLIKQGFTPLDPQKCLHLLETLLTTSRIQVTVASLNWNSFFNSFENQKIPPLLRDFQSFSAPKLTPDNNFIDVLRTIPIEERFAALTAHVQGIVAEILAIPAREFTQVDQGFFELGMDSLMTVELRNRLAKDLGKSLAATITFKYPTVTSLVDYLVAEVIDLDFSLKPLAIGANQDSNLDPLNEEDLSLEELSDLLLQELNSLS